MQLLPTWSRPTWIKVIAGVFGFGVFSLAVFATVVTVYVIRVSEDLPGVEDLADYEPPVMTRVHAGDGRVIAEYARQSRVFVGIEAIPPHVVAAFVSAEDKNFFEHKGVDWMGFARAQLRNALNCVRGGCTKHGGSTITQQVAKNFFLSSEQTIKRKVQEWVVSYRLEKAYDKDKILELYLNEIYLGRRAYGVAAASLLYFGKSFDELTLSETAYLAALPKAPSTLDITREGVMARAIDRRNYVLGRMEANGFITADEEAEARKETLVAASRLSGSTYAAADYFVEEVRRSVFATYGEDELYQGGLSIRTTLDTELQLAARDALRQGLEEYDRRQGWRGALDVIDPDDKWSERLASVAMPTGAGETWAPAVVRRLTAQAATIGFVDGSEGQIPLDELVWARKLQSNGDVGPEIETPSDALARGEVVMVEPLGEERAGAYGLRQIPLVNGALLAMDPHTGRVLAMMGGYSFRLSQFNRATQARRQPGSAFKPFVYAAALDAGYTPVDKVLDAPYVSPNPDQGFYKPQNYTNRWYDLSTLRLGVEKSRNAMTVRLANEIGLERMSAYGEKFGIYDDLPPYEAMSLGAGETTLWRLAAAYSMLVNGGKEVEPTILDRVQDRSGKSIERRDARTCEGCVLAREAADPRDNASLAELILADTGPEAGGLEPLVPQIDADGYVVEPTLNDPRKRVIEQVTAYQVVSMLEGVVERGSGTRVRGLGKPVAGKTGTTNDFRDAWFVGFSPNLVVGVYVGFDTPKPLGDGEAGGRAAAPIFRYFMEEALKDQPIIPFRIPPGVRLVNVDAETGELARPGAPGAILEAFRPGTEPTVYADFASLSGDGFGSVEDPAGVTSTGLTIGVGVRGTAPDADAGAPLTSDDPLAGILDQALRAGDPLPPPGLALRGTDGEASPILSLPEGWRLSDNGQLVISPTGAVLTVEQARQSFGMVEDDPGADLDSGLY